nr:MAG: internal scaffolding protein [Microviridae sp.]
MTKFSDIKIPFFRSGHNYDRDSVSDETGLRCDDPSLTVQADLEPSDINVILKRFGITGQLPSGVRVPQYGDFTGVFDFQSAVNVVALANEAFDSMPAEIRSRFSNDPAKFLDFVHDEANRLEAEKLGIVMPKAEIVKEVIPPVDNS